MKRSTELMLIIAIAAAICLLWNWLIVPAFHARQPALFIDWISLSTFLIVARMFLRGKP